VGEAKGAGERVVQFLVVLFFWIGVATVLGRL